MKKRWKRRQHSQIRFLLVPAVWVILLLLRGGLAHGVSCTPATCPQLTAGLSAAVGIAVDESKNQAYFVEYNGGTLKRINLPPRCGIAGTPPCATTVTAIAAGFSHPEDVQLDLDHGLAYVTTRDDPGTTGSLWKVVLSTGAKSLVTFNLGAPQQLVLDVAHNKAYTVGYNDGRLRSIDLTTGVKTPIITGLGHPVGLAVTNDGKFAYVTEQDAPARISKIDLVLKTKVTNIVTGLTAPFFLAWADPTQNSLYVVERDPANRVSRIDITPSVRYDAITSLPFRPSAIAVRGAGSPAYVTTDSTIVKTDLMALAGPIFMGVGHVPADKIVNGYATTDPGYFYQVKHSPFGGTPNFFGNLVNFRSAPIGATHYEVLLSKDGGPYTPLNLTWNMYKWNTTTLKNDLFAVAPEPGTTKYRINVEADGTYHPELWYPPFLFMRWPSGENGLYTFRVRVYRKVGAVYNDVTALLPAGLNNLVLRVDNTPATVQLLNICQKGVAGAPGNPCAPDKEVKPCDIVGAGPNTYYFKVTAYDANRHLLNYWLSALWGDNKSEVVYSDSYSNHVDGEGPFAWSGVANFIVPRDAPASGGSPSSWTAKCNCAHTFYLGSWKRTIDGYNYILYGDYHKSVTINNVGVTCGVGPCGFPCP